MMRDARLLSVAMPSDERNLEQLLMQLVETNGREDCTLRLVVVRNCGGMWAGHVPGGRASDVIALTADSKDWGESARLTVQSNARFAAGEFTGAKILSWAANLVWAERAHHKGFDEVILLNEHRRVAECTSANIFAVSGNNVFTPPVGDGCLPGITREVLLNEISVPGVRILERGMSIADLEAADEVCITSTTRDLLPVREIEGKVLGRSSGIRERITAAFRQFMSDDVARRRVKFEKSRAWKKSRSFEVSL
jgi:branched-chain amino acid aminotransferase